jgi:hypothetical protein
MSVNARYTVDHPVFSSQVRAAGTYLSDWMDLFEFAEGLLYVDVTAIDPGANIVVTAESSPDKVKAWKEATMTTITATGQPDPLHLANFGRFVRIKAVVAGGNATFSSKLVGKT